jgi:hypothetical protein
MNAAEMLERKRRKLELKREAREQAKFAIGNVQGIVQTSRRDRRAAERQLAKTIEKEQAGE